MSVLPQHLGALGSFLLHVDTFFAFSVLLDIDKPLGSFYYYLIFFYFIVCILQF